MLVKLLVECEKKKKRFFFPGVTVLSMDMIVLLFIYLFFLGHCFCSMWFITHALHFLFLLIFFFSISVWMEVMLPQLTVRQPAKFIVSYLETLLR